MSPDERIKELKKQGYISGVMAGKRISERMQVIQNECAKYKCCTDCPFFVQSEDINCGILSRNPVNWKLNKVHVIRLINQ